MSGAFQRSGDGGSLSLVNFNEHSTQIHSWQKRVANGDGSVEKLSFVAGKLLYHIVLFCFLKLLQLPWK